MANLLLDKGADVNAKATRPGALDVTSLYEAVVGKGYATVEVLLERGAEINAKKWTWEDTN
jgi:hypothetical protein